MNLAKASIEFYHEYVVAQQATAGDLAGLWPTRAHAGHRCWSAVLQHGEA
jgi:hypothetical protein